MADTQRLVYGSDPLQYGMLHPAAGVVRGTVILIHGGFWRWNPEYFDGPTGMARELASLGWNVWQVEYRAMGAGGGWPHTLDDIKAAIDYLAQVQRTAGLELGEVIAAGHSAGGHLAVWALAQELAVPLSGAVSLAGVLDLRLAERDNLGGGAVARFLDGTSAALPERYDSASPAENPVASRPVRMINGDADDIVPLSQGRSYLAAATAAGQDVRLEEFAGDHFDVIEVAHGSWRLTLAAVEELTADKDRNIAATPRR